MVERSKTAHRARPNPVTGLQAAQLALASQLRAWAQQFSPREYATLLDLHRRWVEAECERVGDRWLEDAA
jgi:hypothetical protein